MNNEPVAWINKDEYHGWLNWDKNTEMPINIPLYTHPVKEYFEDEPQAEELHEIMQSNLELTDEEIMDLWCDLLEDASKDIRIFARAILRKAQEK